MDRGIVQSVCFHWRIISAVRRDQLLQQQHEQSILCQQTKKKKKHRLAVSQSVNKLGLTLYCANIIGSRTVRCAIGRDSGWATTDTETSPFFRIVYERPFRYMLVQLTKANIRILFCLNYTQWNGRHRLAFGSHVSAFTRREYGGKISTFIWHYKQFVYISNAMVHSLLFIVQ